MYIYIAWTPPQLSRLGYFSNAQSRRDPATRPIQFPTKRSARCLVSPRFSSGFLRVFVAPFSSWHFYILLPSFSKTNRNLTNSKIKVTSPLVHSSATPSDPEPYPTNTGTDRRFLLLPSSSSAVYLVSGSVPFLYLSQVYLSVYSWSPRR
ncbi:hypothetical protein R3P38DRAFT_1034331 [Favolaschia claudopus]|uniref:Uncharacterized protein n=1 Tax=Favolaschia claudopus TaxID=2862362 RepID=A0AAW0BHH3_9AGAR